jgi:hypothetical protein
LASIVQDPVVVKVTTPPEMLHTVEVVASIVRATVNPEVADATGA